MRWLVWLVVTVEAAASAQTAIRWSHNEYGSVGAHAEIEVGKGLHAPAHSGEGGHTDLACFKGDAFFTEMSDGRMTGKVQSELSNVFAMTYVGGSVAVGVAGADYDPVVAHQDTRRAYFAYANASGCISLIPSSFLSLSLSHSVVCMISHNISLSPLSKLSHAIYTPLFIISLSLFLRPLSFS